MNNIKNIDAMSLIVTDDSTGQIEYYFDGKEHPFVQLNASGAGNNNSKTILKGDIDRPIRELVGLFDASDGGASWSVNDSWTNPEPRYALDASALWNGAKELTKETVVSIGGYVSKYAEPPEIKEQTSKVFFPSKGEYEINPVVAGKVYSACGDAVWSRSAQGNGGAWCIGNCAGDMGINDSVSDKLSAVPSFNLDLSKILMVRRAYDGEDVWYTDNNMPFKYCDAWTEKVKFLAMTDNVDFEARVIMKSDKYIGLAYKTIDDNWNAYLSAIITDKDDNMLYYNVIKHIPSTYDEDLYGEGSLFMYGEDSAVMTLPDNLPEGYKVGVFREVRRRAYYTDTCTEIIWLDV